VSWSVTLLFSVLLDSKCKTENMCSRRRSDKVRVIADYSGSGSVDFQEFVGGLSAFSSKGGREEKLRCEYFKALQPFMLQRRGCRKTRCGVTLTPVAFKVYDMDRDGYISNGELYLVLKQMVGNNLKVSCEFLT
jgi:hypothetical protein